MRIEFSHVSVMRGGVAALEDFSLVAEHGEVISLVGRSGAGKSTALRLVNRLVEPTTGAVHLDGRDTREWDAYALRRRVGYVMQEIGLFPHMTVEQNVGLIPTLERWPGDRVKARTLELLELVGLPPGAFARRWPHQLSGGQRQRVGVARALALDPPILLMDEPFGALDPITRTEMHDEFLRIQSQVRKTVLLVSHDLGEAFGLAARVAVMDGGRLVACDTPARIAESDDPRVRVLVRAATPPPLLRTLSEAR